MPATATAEYKVTFAATWSPGTHPHEFPSSPHFSGLIGATHGSLFTMWEPGGMASPGIKSMAETGSKSPLDSEIDAALNGGSAGSKISGGGVGTSPGSVSVTFTIKADHPLVSLVTMIAPSPDWFVGVHGLSLCEANQWVKEKKVDLPAYDGGTDSGESYASANKATSPAEPIKLLQSKHAVVNGKPEPFGTLTFVKQ